MNGLTAILVILIAFAIGDYVSFKTNATFSMLFVTAVIFWWHFGWVCPRQFLVIQDY